jgi:hypothetical protein
VITETLSTLLAYVRSTRAERASKALAAKLRKLRVERLRSLPTATLRVELAHTEQLLSLVDSLPNQTPTEAVGRASLQDRVDEINAELERRKEQQS